jgi:mannosyltransferase
MPAANSSRAWTHVLALLLIVAGICLRWVYLGRLSLWFDEGYTAWLVSLPATQIVRTVHVDTAPPLFYLLLRMWTLLFGRSEFALRSLSAVCASIALLIFYPLAIRVLRDRRVAVVALAIFAVSVLQVAYAHDARFYALMTLLAEMDLFLVLLAIDGPSAWKYFALIVAWALSLYSNNMMAVYLLALAGAWLVFPGHRSVRKRILDILLVSATTALLYLPWLPTMLAQSQSLRGDFWIDRPKGEALIRSLAVLAGVNHRGVGGWELQRISLACAGFLVFVVAGFISRQTIRRSIALAIFGLLPVLGIFMYSQVRQSIFVDRAFIPSTLITPLIIALPLTWQALRRWWINIAVAVLALTPGILSLRENYLGEHREDWRDVCNFVQADPVQRRLVIFVANEGELLYDYYARGGDYTPSANLTGAPMSFFASDPPRTMRRVRSRADLELLQRTLDREFFDEIVLVESHFWWSDEAHLALGLLSKSFILTDQAEFDGIMVHRFKPRTPVVQ